MTFITIIAQIDGFFLIGDTMISDETPLVFSMNNQKVFISKKHRLGLCICDRMLLVHKQRVKSDVYVSHILREFFQLIESEETVTVDSLQRRVIDFIDDQYFEYENFLHFHDFGKKDPRDCNYLFGGFLNEGGVSIHSHCNGTDASLTTEQQRPAFFSNHGGKLQYYLQLVAERLNTTVGDLLTERMEEVLYEVIPRTCDSVNAEKPYSVGKELHVVRFTRNAEVGEFFYRYSIIAETSSVQCYPIPTICYAIPKTLEDDYYSEGNPRYFSAVEARMNEAKELRNNDDLKGEEEKM